MWGPPRLAMLGRMNRLPWLALAFAVCVPAAADLAYKIVGPDGSVVYTDRPVPGARPVQIPKPSTYVPPDLPATTRLAPPPEPVVTDVYTDIRIATPEPDGTVNVVEGGVDIDVLLKPELLEGHTLTYTIDGKEIAKGLRTNRVRVTDLDRGTHHLEVVVRDDGGAVVGRSPRVTFHVRRPTVTDGQRRDGQPIPPWAGPAPLPPPGYAPARPGAGYVPAPLGAGYAPTRQDRPPYVPGRQDGPPFLPPPTAPYAPAYTPTPAP